MLKMTFSKLFFTKKAFLPQFCSLAVPYPKNDEHYY